MSSDSTADRTGTDGKGADAAVERGRRARQLLLHSPQGLVVMAMLVLWLVIATARDPRASQDAVPFVVAGELVRSNPDQVYIDEDGSLFDVKPLFHERTCEIMGDALDCANAAVAFVSPAPAVPVAVALSWLGPDLALRLMRLTAAAFAVIGMVAMWNRLSTRTERAPTYLAVTSVAMTPLVLVPIGLGQTSPMMFASAALGVAAWDRPGWRRAALVALLTAVVSFKLLPVLLLGVLLLQRRWVLVTSVVAALAALSVIGLAFGGTQMVTDYATASRAIEAQGAENPSNGALDAAVYRAARGALTTGSASALANGAKVVLVAAVAMGIWRLPRDDRQWALAWAGLVVIAPLAWWHYSLASIGAIGTALACSRTSDRDLRLLPTMALIGLPFGLLNNSSRAVPTLQWLWALAALGVVWVIASRSTRPSRRDTATPTSP